MRPIARLMSESSKTNHIKTNTTNKSNKNKNDNRNNNGSNASTNKNKKHIHWANLIMYTNTKNSTN